MSFDQEKYRAALRPLNLPREREDEILASLYTMMENFVLCAFGKHPVQQAQQAQKKSLPRGKSGPESAPVLDFLHPDIKQQFIAAHNQPAAGEGDSK